MGIKQLMALIQDKAPRAIKSLPLEHLTGKTVAVDASMAIYQFLIATQNVGRSVPGIMEMRDEEGNLTAHLVGIFYRTILLLENGVKPIWVFDGKPPQLKSKELDKRKEQKQQAEEERKKAEEAGDMERAKQMAGRSIRITDEMMQDAKKLIGLLGVPVVEAPCEAEAQCAEIVKMGLAYATVTEDMDALTFGTNYLLRGVKPKELICQIEHKEILEGFEMTQAEFVDLCILCGCDYTQNIGGLGPVTAFKMIKEHGNIEAVLELVKAANDDPLRKKKYIIPDNFLYKESRDLFVEPDVIRDKEALEKLIEFKAPAEEELKKFLVDGKNCQETKVINGIERLKKSAGKKNQTRLDGFFKSTGVVLSSTKKVEAPKGKGGKGTAKKGLGGRKKSVA